MPWAELFVEDTGAQHARTGDSRTWGDPEVSFDEVAATGVANAKLTRLRLRLRTCGGGPGEAGLLHRTARTSRRAYAAATSAGQLPALRDKSA